MSRNNLSGWMRTRAKMLLAVVAIGALAVLLLSLHLGNLMPGANHYELAAIDRLGESIKPWSQAVNAPYFLIATIVKSVFSSLLALRITSALFGLATAACLGYVIRQWFGDRVAVAGTLLIISNSWFLHLARIGAPFISSCFFLSALLALGTWRTYTTKPLVIDLLLILTMGLSLYQPYFLWLVIFGTVAFLVSKNRRLISEFHWKHWLTPIILAITGLPLLIAVIHNHASAALLGLNSLSNNGIVYTDHLVTNIRQLFFRGEYDPSLNLGHLPFLDIFSNVMVGIGLYYFERRLRLRRSQVMLGGSLALLTVISLSPFAVANLSIMLPIVMLFIIGGVVELLNRWLDGFPRNPIARSVGVVMLVTAIGFTSFYHLQRYFVAWSNYPDAVNAHHIQTTK